MKTGRQRRKTDGNNWDYKWRYNNWSVSIHRLWLLDFISNHKGFEVRIANGQAHESCRCYGDFPWRLPVCSNKTMTSCESHRGCSVLLRCVHSPRLLSRFLAHAQNVLVHVRTFFLFLSSIRYVTVAWIIQITLWGSWSWNLDPCQAWFMYVDAIRFTKNVG